MAAFRQRGIGACRSRAAAGRRGRSRATRRDRSTIRVSALRPRAPSTICCDRPAASRRRPCRRSGSGSAPARSSRCARDAAVRIERDGGAEIRLLAARRELRAHRPQHGDGAVRPADQGDTVRADVGLLRAAICRAAVTSATRSRRAEHLALLARHCGPSPREPKLSGSSTTKPAFTSCSAQSR